MTGEFYFTTVAGIALSVAGFASLVTALRREGRWSRVELWRLRNIVREALSIVIVSMLPLPIYYAVGGDGALMIRIVSGLLTLISLLKIWRAFGERQEWGGRYVVIAVANIGLQAFAHIANIWLASLPLLMFGLLFWLVFPIQLFLRVIRDFQPPLERD